MSGRRLGELLVQSGAITDEQLREALQHQTGKRLKIGEALIELGHSSAEVVARALAKQAGMPFLDLSKGKVSEAILKQVPAEVVESHRILPVLERKGKLVIAMDDPAVAYQLDDLSFVLNRPIQPVLTTPAELAARIKDYYQLDVERGSSKRAAVVEQSADEEDAPIIRLVQHVVESAYDQRASDIHIEPTSQRVRVRFRIDGMLREVGSHPRHLHGPLLSRLKIMAGLDISERRKPQDGRIQMSVRTTDLDIRASVLPSNHGESIVMRLLDREKGLQPLTKLGFDGDDYQRFQGIIQRPNGIVLVTGPTGSGKTTTLYGALQELNRPDRKLITAEDPVEYHIQGINQVQVHHKIGLDFARILRAMLRQAPNIILVGEIRDRETAEVAIQAALTGHLVFSTLHTNDAPSALTRLIDIGVQPFLVAASVTAVMAQRLVRMLCQECKQPYEVEESELATLQLRTEQLGGRSLYREQGCTTCEGSGFQGRMGVFELLEMDGRIRDMTFRREPHIRIREEALMSGRMTALLEDGQRKVLSGRTTIREVLRVVSANH
jgi:type IV pilus assembly protein PilB